MLRLFALHGCGPLSMTLAAAALSLASSANAETEAIRIEYSALPVCPNADEFRAKVFERATSARLAEGAEPARTFVVSIERGRKGVLGSLIVRELNGATVAREVEGAECAEVATALALATALAIDPQASPVREEPAKPEVPPAPRAEERSEESPVSAPTHRTRAWSAALGPNVESGIAPRLSLGGSVQVEWYDPAAGALVSALGAELAWLEVPKQTVSGASSSFRFLLARPLLCSLELPSAGTLRFSPCLGAELGAVTGRGGDLPAPSTETRFWAAADVLLRARLTPTEAWFVELDGALVLPFTRYHYLFREPDTEIYRAPPLAAALRLKFGVQL